MATEASIREFFSRKQRLVPAPPRNPIPATISWRELDLWAVDAPGRHEHFQFIGSLPYLMAAFPEAVSPAVNAAGELAPGYTWSSPFQGPAHETPEIDWTGFAQEYARFVH